MASLLQHSIVLVSFPFDDLSRTKVRPALCLTNVIGDYGQNIIAFISSEIPLKVLGSDVIIFEDTPQWTDTGLLVTSVIRLHKIVTIPISAIKRRLGWMDADVRRQVHTKLLELFSSK